MVLIFWNFTMFYCRPNELPVQWNVISIIAHLVYELPREFSKDLRLRILRKNEILGESEIRVEK